MHTARSFSGFTATVITVLLISGCVDLEDEAPAGESWFETPAMTMVYAPAEVHTYEKNLYLAAPMDAEGKYLSGATMTVFEYEREGDPEEEVAMAHEIGSSGVYGIGMSGQPATHGLALATPGTYHFHFHAMHGGKMYEGKTEVEAEAGHADVEDSSGSAEYKVNFWLEEGGVPTGHVHEGDTLNILFQVLDDATETPITTGINPTLYVAERGGSGATSGQTNASVTPDSLGEGRYVISYTWNIGDEGEWDLTIDLDGDVTTTHGDRATWTIHVDAEEPATP